MKVMFKIASGILLLFLVPGISKTFAQQPDFVVYYATAAKVKKINQTKHVAIKKGDKLYLSDWLSIPKNAQLILICQNHQCIKLYKADTVKLVTVQNSCTEDKHSFASAFFHYIWDDLTGKEPKAEDYSNNNGAIDRGNSELGAYNFLPDTINYLSGPLKLSWTNSHMVNIRFYRKADDDSPFKEINSRTDHFRLDAAIAYLHSPGVYYWAINTVNDQNIQRNYLRLWRQPAYEHEVNRVLKNVVKTSPAETAFMSGFLLEHAGFMTEAAKYYKKAVALARNSKTYNTANSRFL